MSESSERLLAQLRAQLQFIKNSCEAYDAGDEDEARRIATTLRTLFHTNPHPRSRTVSLMSHLKKVDVTMLSSGAGDNLPESLTTTRIALSGPSGPSVRAVPRLGSRFRKVTFAEWWFNESVFVIGGTRIARRDLVLTATEQDGGAHIDLRLEKVYELITTGEQSAQIDVSKLEYSHPPPFDLTEPRRCTNAHLASLRQIGHEVIGTSIYFQWLKVLAAELA